MIGDVVQVKLADGTLVPGLVTHEWPHDENTGLDNPRKINAVYVSTDPADMAGSGRVTRVVSYVVETGRKRRLETMVPYSPGCEGEAPCWCEWGTR